MKEIIEAFGAIKSPFDARDYKLVASATETFPETFELPKVTVKNQGAVGSCHDEQTEVLTRNGWKFFKDITYDDLLASVDPQSGDLIFEKPTNIIQERYCGEMIHGQHMSLDFLVTPNHKMVVRKWIEKDRALSNDYQFVEAQDLGWYVGLRQDYHQHKPLSDDIVLAEEKASNGNILAEHHIDMYDWVQFLGIYLAEGTLYKDGKDSHYRIQLAAVKQREKDYIRDLLRRMGINGINEQKDRFHFHNKRIWTLMESYGLVGVKSYEKFVPDFIFDLDESYIEKFLFGYSMGDGMHTKGGKVEYFTSSKTMAEQIQILSLLCGKYGKIYEKSPGSAKNVPIIRGREIHAKHIAYTIANWSGKNLSIDKKKNITCETYDGYVYCAEVPTYHTLITRRNKNVLLSGNCVAHASSSVVEYHHKKQHNEKVVFSTEFIYGLRDFGYYVGEGMYIRNALNTLRKYGDVPLADLKGNHKCQEAMEIVNEKFDELEEKAYPNRISSYFRIYDESSMKNALMNHGYVLVGMKWHKGAKLVNGIYTPTDEVSGGHAIVIYGWNKKGWLAQNSWGGLWGNKGRFIIPFDFKFDEMWGITDNITDDIVMPRRGKIWDILYKIYNAIINFFTEEINDNV